MIIYIYTWLHVVLLDGILYGFTLDDKCGIGIHLSKIKHKQLHRLDNDVLM